MIDIEKFKETIPDIKFTKYQVLNIIDFITSKNSINIDNFRVTDLKINDKVYSIFDDKVLTIVEINKDDIGLYIYYDNNTLFYYLNDEVIKHSYILMR
jgi:hypothetical protein